MTAINISPLREISSCCGYMSSLCKVSCKKNPPQEVNSVIRSPLRKSFQQIKVLSKPFWKFSYSYKLSLDGFIKKEFTQSWRRRLLKSFSNDEIRLRSCCMEKNVLTKYSINISSLREISIPYFLFCYKRNKKLILPPFL